MTDDTDCQVIELPPAAPRHDPEHPAVTARLRVVSDGTWIGTQVLANGKPLRGVTSVTWAAPADPKSFASVTVQFDNVPVDLVGEHDITAGKSAEQP